MKWNINCRQATHLLLQGEDQPLGWADRLRLRLHLMICQACPRFVRQVAFMRTAVGRWRAYRDQGGGPPAA